MMQGRLGLVNIRFAKLITRAASVMAALGMHGALADQASVPDCAKVKYDSRCFWMSHGEPAIDSPDTKGDSVIRVDGGVSLRFWLSIMVEFRHDKLGGNWMVFRDPESNQGAIRLPTSEQVWNSMRANLNTFQAEQAEFQVRHKKDLATRKDIVVCTDGSDVAVDSVIDGNLLHYEADSCENESVDRFIDTVRGLAYSQIPYCSDKSLQRPQTCLSLEGDKYFAAELLSRYMKIDWSSCDKSDPAVAVFPLLADDVVLREESGNAITGAHNVADAWKKHVCSMGKFPIGPWPVSVVGRGDEVTLVGTTSGATTKPSPESGKNVDYEVSSESTQLWRKDASGTFHIVSWIIGKKIERKLW